MIISYLIFDLVASSDLLVAKQVALLFDNPYFRTELSTDVSTVEFCGALKNIVSIGAGIRIVYIVTHDISSSLSHRVIVSIFICCKLFTTEMNINDIVYIY